MLIRISKSKEGKLYSSASISNNCHLVTRWLWQRWRVERKDVLFLKMFLILSSDHIFFRKNFSIIFFTRFFKIKTLAIRKFSQRNDAFLLLAILNSCSRLEFWKEPQENLSLGRRPVPGQSPASKVHATTAFLRSHPKKIIEKNP